MDMSTPCTEEEVFGISWEDAINLPMFKLLENASRLLGEVNNISSGIFEHEFIISTLKNIESLDSAKIEGTTGNLEDLYKQDDLDFERKKQLKLFSAINYRKTIDDLEGISSEYKELSMSLIRHLHKLLTENDPATKGIPGKFREKEVRIANSRLGDFHPPSWIHVQELMEKYLKSEEQMKELPDLMRIAIQHVRFESIHPFEDGNGRTGRLLINMHLLQKGLLTAAVLNLSEFFEDNREEYITNLRLVTDKKSYQEWIKYFLTGVIVQCQKAIELIAELKKIREGNVKMLDGNGKHALSIEILDYSLNHLFVNVPDITEALREKNKRFKAINQIVRNEVKKFVKMGILKKTDRRQGRADIFIHNELGNLLFSKQHSYGTTAKAA